MFVGSIDRGHAVAAQAAGEGLAIDFLPIDLTQTDTIAAFAAAVHDRLERVTGWSTAPARAAFQPFLENPPEMWTG